MKVQMKLLTQFFDVDAIKDVDKRRLVSTMLSGHLALCKKLVMQRTKLDDTQDKLLELLKDMTTCTEAETSAETRPPARRRRTIRTRWCSSTSASAPLSTPRRTTRLASSSSRWRRNPRRKTYPEAHDR